MTIEEAENDPRVKGIFEIEKAGSGSSEEYGRRADHEAES